MGCLIRLWYLVCVKGQIAPSMRLTIWPRSSPASSSSCYRRSSLMCLILLVRHCILSHSQRLSKRIYYLRHREACILFGRGPRYRRPSHVAILLQSQAQAWRFSNLRSVSPSASSGDSGRGQSLQWETWHGLSLFKLRPRPVLTVGVQYCWRAAFSVLLRSIRRGILPRLRATGCARSYSHAREACACLASRPDRCTHRLRRSLLGRRTSYTSSQFVGPWSLTPNILCRGSVWQFA